MTVALVFIALNMLLSLSTLGLVFALARGSSAVRLTPVLALAFWPSLSVFALSFAGYMRAVHMLPWLALTALAIGLLWTLVQIVRERAAFAAMDWAAFALAQPVCWFAGALVIAPHIWNGDFGYSEFGNGEFINYAQLASYSLGLQHTTIPVAWEQYHQSLRDGIDFINGLISTITAHPPIDIVQLTAAELRCACFAALYALTYGLLGERPYRSLWAAVICAAFALSPVDLFNFTTSFMGGILGLNITLCLIGIVVAGSAIGRIPALVAYVIVNVALLVSYPEAMVILKIAEAAFVIEQSVRQGNRELLIRWLIGNVLVVAVNPVLAVTKATYFLQVTSSASGWDVMGNPRGQPWSYLGRLVGIEPIYRSDLALFRQGSVVGITAIAVGFGLGLMAIATLSARLKSLTPWLILALVVGLHAVSAVGLKPHFYAAMKATLAWLWLLPLGVAAAYLSSGWRVRAAVTAAAVLIVAGNAATLWRSTAALLALPTFHSSAQRTAVVEAARARGASVVAAVDTADGGALWYWLQAFDDAGIAIAPLDAVQLDRFSRSSPSPQTIAPQLVTFVVRPLFQLTYQAPAIDLKLEPAAKAPLADGALKLRPEPCRARTVACYAVGS